MSVLRHLEYDNLSWFVSRIAVLSYFNLTKWICPIYHDNPNHYLIVPVSMNRSDLNLCNFGILGVDATGLN